MARWEPDAASRLQRAALDLFAEQGFAETSVPQITARAGLTTRTFFRHFADKREVLFAGEEAIPDVVARVLAAVPAGATPMTVVVQSLADDVAPYLTGFRDHLLAIRAVVRSEPSLRERELRKLALIEEAARQGFVERGVDELTAALVARIAATLFDVSLARWLDEDPPRPLGDVVRETARALGAVTAGLGAG